MPAVLGAGARTDHQVDQLLQGQVIEEGEPLLEGQVIQSHIFGQKRRLPGKVPDGGQHRPDLSHARSPVDQEVEQCAQPDLKPVPGRFHPPVRRETKIEAAGLAGRIAEHRLRAQYHQGGCASRATVVQ